MGGELCFVPQGNTLMSGTIRYNLQLAKPDATEDELRQVLHTACADFVFDLPDSINTELGERGSGLSEGQAQRIAIARGLLHGGDIRTHRARTVSPSLYGIPTKDHAFHHPPNNCQRVMRRGDRNVNK